MSRHINTYLSELYKFAVSPSQTMPMSKMNLTPNELLSGTRGLTTGDKIPELPPVDPGVAPSRTMPMSKMNQTPNELLRWTKGLTTGDKIPTPTPKGSVGSGGGQSMLGGGAGQEIVPYSGRQIVPAAGRQLATTAGKELAPMAGKELAPVAGRSITPFVSNASEVAGSAGAGAAARAGAGAVGSSLLRRAAPWLWAADMAHDTYQGLTDPKALQHTTDTLMNQGAAARAVTGFVHPGQSILSAYHAVADPSAINAQTAAHEAANDQGQKMLDQKRQSLLQRGLINVAPNGQTSAAHTGAPAPSAAPSSAPAPAPAPSAAPGSSKFAPPSPAELAMYQKQTGTQWNSHSKGDITNLARMRNNKETFDSAQYRDFSRQHPNSGSVRDPASVYNEALKSALN